MRILFSLIFTVLLFGCSDSSTTTSYAGTGSMGGNPYALSIVDPSGNPVDSALIFIRKINYVSEDLTTDREADLYSNKDGEVNLEFSSDSSYMVEITYNGFLSKKLSSESIRALQQSDNPVIVLDSTSSFYGSLDSSLIGENKYYLQIIGLERTVLIESDGSFHVDNLPSGMNRYRIVDETGRLLYETDIETLPNESKNAGEIKEHEMAVLKTALSEMNLSEIPLEEIAGFNTDGNIVSIDLQYRDLSTISSTLSNLNLSVLKLGNNPLDSIPFWITEMESLTRLEMSNCELEELPENIGKMENLNTLIVSNNKLSKIPSSLLENDLIDINIQNNYLSAVDTKTELWLDSASMSTNWQGSQL